MRKRKWIDSFLENEKVYLIEDGKGLKNIILEIGMGMGDFITESARRNPDKFYIGLEKNASCVARAIKKAEEFELKNLKIVFKDASNLLELFDEGSVDTIYLHFSDPWPKKGHHKRRLTYITFLNMYDKLLKDDGHIIFKTDNQPLFEDSLEYFEASPFKVDELDRDYHKVKRDEPLTGYEAKFKDLGNPINYAKLSKRVSK